MSKSEILAKIPLLIRPLLPSIRGIFPLISRDCRRHLRSKERVRERREEKVNDVVEPRHRSSAPT